MQNTPKFYLKRKTPNKETAIRMRISINGSLFYYNIGRSILPELWNDTKCKPFKPNENKEVKATIKAIEKTNPNIKIDLENVNTRLRNITSSIKSILNQYDLDNEVIDFRELKDKLDTRYKETKTTEKRLKSNNLNAFIEYFVNGIGSGEITFTQSNGSVKKYQPSTVKAYKEWKTQFDLFQKTKKRKYNYNDITIDFYNMYVSYFIKKNYGTNAIGKQIKTLKSIMNYSHENGLHSNLEYKRKAFKTLKEDVHSIYLTQKELDSIYKLDLKDQPKLDVIRDVFLVGCYTALRYSDYSRIKASNIVKNNNIDCIDIITKKTGERVIVPIRPELKKILKKYKNKLPKTYEQKVNFHIKDICQMAEIDEPIETESIIGALKVQKKTPKHNLVKTHTARRTGATLMYKANIPTIDIMKITGHKKESSLMKYIKVSKEETVIRMAHNPFFMSKII